MVNILYLTSIANSLWVVNDTSLKIKDVMCFENSLLIASQ